MLSEGDGESKQYHLGWILKGKKKCMNHNIIKALKLISSPQEILSIKDAVHKEAIHHISKEGSYIGL